MFKSISLLLWDTFSIGFSPSGLLNGFIPSKGSIAYSFLLFSILTPV
jgi:hypothetical protein